MNRPRCTPEPLLRSAPLVLLAGLLLAGCASDHDSTAAAPTSPGARLEAPGATLAARDLENPPFDPAHFVAGVDHPYFPLVPGTTWTLREADGDETNTIEVLDTAGSPKVILGVTATVVRDRVWVGDELVEDTLDWFAQDEDGNVWYLGEDVKNYAGGVLVDTEGSWEAGVNGARAGINMLAAPEAGDTYFQEDAPGVAEDMAKVKRLGTDVSVPYGDFPDALQILEWTPLEHGKSGYKYYASGVGLVLETGTNGKGRSELVSVTLP